MATRARKKTGGSGQLVSKASATAIASIEESLKREREAANSTLDTAVGNSIQVKSKNFVFPSRERVPEFFGVIVDYARYNVYFRKPYVEGQITPATCFALTEPASLGGNPKDMAPPDDLATKISDQCEGCGLNEFGSDSRGKGKECKNRIMLVIMNPTDPNSDLLRLSVSPTAIAPFAAYVANLHARQNLSPISVVTKFSFDPKQATDSVRFEADRPDPEAMAAAWARRPEAQMLLRQRPQTEPLEEREEQPKKKTGTRRRA